MKKNSNVREYFSKVIGLAMESAEMVVDPKDRAVAYAQIANALATTGLIITGESQLEAVLDTTQSNVSETNEEAQEAVEEVQETAEEVKEETVQEVEKAQESEEQTKEAELDPEVQEAVKYVNDLLEEYEYDEIEAQVAEFAPGVYSTMEDITEDNIVAFAQHLKELIEG